MYARDLNEPKYEYFIKKREGAWIKHLNNPNAFIGCSNTMDDVYENINDYHPIRKRKKLIVFDDMIADILTNKKFKAIIKELFIRCIKLNSFTCFYRSILFFGSKRCQIKYNRIFHHETKQQKRITKYCN